MADAGDADPEWSERDAARRLRGQQDAPEIPERLAPSALGEEPAPDARPVFGVGDPTLLSDVLRNLPGSVFQFLLHPDGSYEIPFLSGGVTALAGLDSREVTEQPSRAFDLVHPDDRPRVWASVRRSAETLETWHCDYRIAHPDGSIRWALGIGSPRRLRSGAVLWNTINVDITPQKEAERRARERDAERRELEGLMSLVADTASMGGFLVRPDGTVSLHASTRRILRLETEVSRIEELSACFRDEAADVTEGLRAVASGDVPFWTRDLRRQEGWFRMYTSRRELGAGESIVVGALQDVTRQRAEEDDLHHRQRLDALGRLAGGIAHDFNNLLTVISGSADLMTESVSESNRPLLDEILLAATLGQAMTQRLLTLARRQPVHSVTVDLARHLAEAMPLWRRMVGEHIRLELEVAAEHHWIRFDPRLLDQVLMNLLLNARDAMAKGGPIRIQLEGSDLGPSRAVSSPAVHGWHRLVVTDRGRGMDLETVRRAAEPFFTTKGAEGTGLGLSTSDAIVRQGGGALEVASRLGEGTQVTIWLPRHEPGPESAGGRRRTSERPAGRDVLLVEDDPRVRRVMARMLERCGQRVHIAENAQEALGRLQASPITLVVTDVVMPGTSGPELVAQLRQHRPDLRVLFMSGYPGPEMERLGMSVSDPFLAKPFTLEDLRAKLDEVAG